MKTKKYIKKWTEPLIYVVLVATFGFITTIVTHARSEEPVKDNDLVSFTIENDLEAMLRMAEDKSEEVSL